MSTRNTVQQDLSKFIISHCQEHPDAANPNDYMHSAPNMYSFSQSTLTSPTSIQTLLCRQYLACRTKIQNGCIHGCEIHLWQPTFESIT